MLSLEQRFLERLLPSVAGLDVVDLGCGTGRWLASLRCASPRSLIGVDVSPRNVGAGQAKARGRREVSCSPIAADLPFPRASADLILCSFLTSYVQDLDEVRRTNAAASAARRNRFHHRSAPGDYLEARLATRIPRRRIVRRCRDVRAGPFEEIVSRRSRSLGIQVDAMLEPEFGEPERELFERAGKTEAFHAAAGHPAIYILQLSVKRLALRKCERQSRREDA